MNDINVTLVPVIIAAITAAITVGLFNYKKLFHSIHLWIIGLVEETPSTLDDQTYAMIISAMSDYVRSDRFKEHWDKILKIVEDGKITPEELDLCKKLFSVELVNDLVKVGVDIYSVEGKKLIEQAINEFVDLIVFKTSDCWWLKRVGIKYLVTMIGNWVKSKLDEWIVYNQVQTRQFKFIRQL